MIGQAQTGTGKTAAFMLPFLNRLVPAPAATPHYPTGIVLAPTRELVLQVGEEGRKLAPPDVLIASVIGGQRLGGQERALKAGCHMVVGSPGRVIDHINRGNLKLDAIQYVVLDEADRMLDIGFRPDIEKILRRCPTDRQTLLMSATLPEEVLRLAHRYMRDPTHLNMTPETVTVDKIRQTYFTVDEHRKFELLLRVLERENPRQCIIFAQRKIGTFDLYRKLREHRKGVAAMHGDLPQSQRERIMDLFRKRKVIGLIATDVVGRGIDVNGISHVINYDIPDDPENYVHRIGRTGRMGKDGVAISFVTPEQGGLLTDIEGVINKLIEPDTIEGFETHTPRAARVADAAPEAPRASQPVFGKYKRKYKNW